MLKQQLSENQKALNNVMAAIEAGVLTATTKQRLMDLESENNVLTARLNAIKEDSAALMSREEVIASLKIFQGGDILDKDFQQALIDAWLVRAYVYDDHLKIVFNLGDNVTADLPFDIDAVDFTEDPPESSVQDSSCITESTLHHKNNTIPWG